MKEATVTKPAHSGWNKFLLILLTVLLVLCTYATVLRDNFLTGAKAFVFLKEAKVFVTTAEIVKSEINAKLPDSIKNNYIKQAIVSKLLDIIITPENVAKVAEPGINAAYKLAKAPTDIENNKVVLDTTQYKQQASEYIPGLQLPKVITDAANDLVNAVPNDLTIVDLEKRPNSILATFIRIRDLMRTINDVTNVLWVLTIINLIALVLVNIKSIGRLLHSFGWSFGVAGSIVVVGSYIFPPIATAVVPQSTDPIIGNAMNTMVSNIIYQYFVLTRGYGWLLVLIAVFACLAYWLINTKRAKELLSGGLDKFKQTISGKTSKAHKS